MSTIQTIKSTAWETPAVASGQGLMSLFERILLGVIILEIPVQIDTYLMFQEKWADFGAIGGINVSLSTFCLGLLYLTWLVDSSAVAGNQSRHRLYFSIPLTVYMGLATVSFFVAENRHLALNSIALLGQAYLCYVYVSNRVKTRSDVMFVVTMLLVALAMQAAIMVGLVAIGHSFSVWPVKASLSSDLRPEGTIGSANSAGSYLGLLMLPALGVSIAAASRPVKLAAIAALMLAGVAMLFTMSRGAWIGFGVAVSLFCLIAWHRRWISAWRPIILALAVLMLAGVFQSSIMSRLFSDDGGSALSRIPLNRTAWQIIGDHPVLGVGINNSALVASQYAMMPEYRQEWFYTTHNKYLLEWEELGPLGLGAFLCFLLATMLAGWKTWQRQDELLAPIALGLSLAIITQMLHMTVDIFNNRPQVQMLWLCAGLVAAIYRLPSED